MHRLKKVLQLVSAGARSVRPAPTGLAVATAARVATRVVKIAVFIVEVVVGLDEVCLVSGLLVEEKLEGRMICWFRSCWWMKERWSSREAKDRIASLVEKLMHIG